MNADMRYVAALSQPDGIRTSLTLKSVGSPLQWQIGVMSSPNPPYACHRFRRATVIVVKPSEGATATTMKPRKSMTLAALRKFALGLPEVSEQPHFHFASFRVLGKIFVTVPPEQTHIHVFVDDDEREPALELYPEFVEKLWWGKKVCGLRVLLAQARPEVVESLVIAAWRRRAPKRLHGRIEGKA